MGFDDAVTVPSSSGPVETGIGAGVGGESTVGSGRDPVPETRTRWGGVGSGADACSPPEAMRPGVPTHQRPRCRGPVWSTAARKRKDSEDSFHYTTGTPLRTRVLAQPGVKRVRKTHYIKGPSRGPDTVERLEWSTSGDAGPAPA